jgi:Zn-finger protein
VVHVANIGPAARFSLSLDADGALALLHDGQFVTNVYLPPASAFYRQTTSRGVGFRGLAVLQGHDALAFPYLWPCEYARAGQACRFCHCGNYTQQQAALGICQGTLARAQDVAEVVHYAVNVERCARHVQLTGGSTFQTSAEYGQIVEIMAAIDRVAGLANVPGEIILYTTPAEDVKQVDALFAAGVDRIACDMEIWDEDLAGRICPGKYKWTGRRRHLETLEYIAKAHGPNKACSTFVVGLEPAESFLAGAEYLARRGIVPIPSIWMPHGLAPIPGNVVADLDFFRRIRRGLARIYCTYGCEPPGGLGFNVCLCRDTWNSREEILAAS